MSRNTMLNGDPPAQNPTSVGSDPIKPLGAHNAIDIQAEQLSKEAEQLLAKIKHQEQQKLNDSIAQIHAATQVIHQELDLRLIDQSSSTSRAQQEGYQKALAALMALKLEGEPLPPLEAIKKIQAIHLSTLDSLLEQIKNTIKIDEDRDKQL